MAESHSASDRRLHVGAVPLQRIGATRVTLRSEKPIPMEDDAQDRMEKLLERIATALETLAGFAKEVLDAAKKTDE